MLLSTQPNNIRTEHPLLLTHVRKYPIISDNIRPAGVVFLFTGLFSYSLDFLISESKFMANEINIPVTLLFGHVYGAQGQLFIATSAQIVICRNKTSSSRYPFSQNTLNMSTDLLPSWNRTCKRPHFILDCTLFSIKHCLFRTTQALSHITTAIKKYKGRERTDSGNEVECT